MKKMIALLALVAFFSTIVNAQTTDANVNVKTKKEVLGKEKMDSCKQRKDKESCCAAKASASSDEKSMTETDAMITKTDGVKASCCAGEKKSCCSGEANNDHCKKQSKKKK